MCTYLQCNIPRCNPHLYYMVFLYDKAVLRKLNKILCIKLQIYIAISWQREDKCITNEKREGKR